MESRFNVFKERFPGFTDFLILVFILFISLFIVPNLIDLFFDFLFGFSQQSLNEVNSAFDKITELSMQKHSQPISAAVYGHSKISQYITDPKLISTLVWYIVVGSSIPNLILGILFVYFFKRKDSTIFLSKGNNYSVYFYSILAFLFAQQFIQVVGLWNQDFVFPIDEVETQLRFLEVKLGIIQQCFFDFKSVYEVLLLVLFIGLLTGIAEEFIFRLGIQNFLLKLKINPHIAILLGAMIFSFVHFQFYGFFVRLILGMLLGYFYYWSKDIKTSIIVHALYNGVAVSLPYIIRASNPKLLEDVSSEDAVLGNEMLFSVIMSTVFCGLLLYRIYQLRKEENTTTL